MNLKHVSRDYEKSPSSVISKATNPEKPACRDGVDPSSQLDVVKVLESEDQFDDLLKKNKKFVVKFTATWCKPCKNIHPFFQQRCAEYIDYEFVTVDVDEFHKAAAKYSIAMMPTFIVVQRNSVVGTYRGSSEPELDEFLRTHLR